MSELRAWSRAAMDIVLPRHCVGCNAPVDNDRPGFVCATCETRVPFVDPPFCYQCALPFAGAVTDPFVCGYCRDMEFAFERTVCGCKATGIARECLHRFKYKKQPHVGPHLADWLVRSVSRWISAGDLDLIVPVPLYPRKKREREFNQSEYLAAALGRSFGVAVSTGNLVRVRDTPTQTHLDAAARAENMRDAFALRRAGVFEGLRVAVLDDVFTTGATIDSCARLLAHAGARQVVAVAFARGI